MGKFLWSSTWQQVLPVVLSIAILIAIAVLQAHSKTLAAIMATMPVTIPLALWVVYAGAGGDSSTVVQFVEALIITMVANLFFVGAVWLAARAGWRLGPLLIVGYATWGMVLGAIMGLRYLLRR